MFKGGGLPSAIEWAASELKLCLKPWPFELLGPAGASLLTPLTGFVAGEPI